MSLHRCNRPAFARYPQPNLMPTMNFRLIRSPLAAALVSTLAFTAAAQGPAAWPAKPIRIVVPFQAGSATDMLSRQIGTGLSK